ncbi:hypothetical protein HAX54_051404, partial [Datura stramonium]|nr:hypothetical protein [Datura stramonium]
VLGHQGCQAIRQTCSVNMWEIISKWNEHVTKRVFRKMAFSDSHLMVASELKSSKDLSLDTFEGDNPPIYMNRPREPSRQILEE